VAAVTPHPQYVTGDSLSSTLSGYVTASGLTSALAPYAATSALSGYATVASLSACVTSSALTSTLADYATAAWVASQLAPHQSLLSMGLFAPQAYDAYSTGTYNLTTTPALIAPGSGTPSVTLATAGTYRMSARCVLSYAGATLVAGRVVTVKMRKTSGTPADLANGAADVSTGTVTLLTGPLAVVVTPDVRYTAAAGDVVSVFGSVSGGLSAGNLAVTAASLHAQRVA
jgi:hypothetical protein